MVPPLLALFSFPLLVIILFAQCKPVMALILSIIVGYLVLPHGVGYDLPVLPSIDKDFIPAVSTLLALLMVLGQNSANAQLILPNWVPRDPLVLLFFALIIFGNIGMVMTNGDRLIYGPLVLPGLSAYDVGSQLMQTAVMLIPFLLARRFLAHPETHLMLLKVFVVAGMIYSLLALYEVRLSPQLNINIYGYFQHSWIQHLRGNGYRPIIFLQHGLWVSIFFSTASLAAFALFRAKEGPVPARFLMMALWLVLTLVLTKSLGALLITVLLAPVILFFNARTQIMVAFSIAILVMSFPMLRSAGLIPVDRISALAYSIDPYRAGSLTYRLETEDSVLKKVQERPVFGWGTFGRNRLYDEYGRSNETDGYWIIILGRTGWVGYLGVFGLVSAGIIGLFIASRRIELSPATAGLSLMLAGNMVDLIPNATLTPLTWLIAGALLGRLEYGAVTEPARDAIPSSDVRSVKRYSRFGPPRGQPRTDLDPKSDQSRWSDQKATPVPVQLKTPHRQTRHNNSSKLHRASRSKR